MAVLTMGYHASNQHRKLRAEVGGTLGSQSRQTRQLWGAELEWEALGGGEESWRLGHEGLYMSH